MFYIDGSEKSGSGTIVRHAVALASLLGQEINLNNIRAKRGKPGLRPQHLASVMACAKMSNAQVEGASVNSAEISYKPRGKIKGGYYQLDIGTAGSSTLLAMTLLPLALFADDKTTFKISGGLFQDFAPSAHHMRHVLLPTLEKMGIKLELKVIRPGYVPTGGGVIEVKVNPVARNIKALALQKQGKVKKVLGVALSSHLREQKVSQRMTKECQKVLAEEGYYARINNLWDETALQAGANLSIWAVTDTGCLLGSDQAGKRGRSSESIGRYVASNLLEDLQTGATVDRYLADQLIIYAALAQGTTDYLIPRRSEHIDTNLWLVDKFGAITRTKGNNLRIEGLDFTRQTRVG